MSQEDSAAKRLKASLLRMLTCCHGDDRGDDRPLQIGYPTVMKREQVTIAGLTDEQHAFIREKAAADAARMFSGGATQQLPLRSHHVVQQQQQQLLPSLRSYSSSQSSLSPTASSRQSCENLSPRSSPTLAPQLSSSSSSSPPPAEAKSQHRVSELVKRLSARICGGQQQQSDEVTDEVKVIDDPVSAKHVSAGASHSGLGLGITQAGAVFGMSGDSITLSGDRADSEGGDERVVGKNSSDRRV